MQVLKKDNKTKECFQEHKIEKVIKKAFETSGIEYDVQAFNNVMHSIGFDDSDTTDRVVSVSYLKELIEDTLLDYNKKVGKAYMLHKMIGEKKEFEKKLMAKAIENQNANIDEYSFGGRAAEAASIYKKSFALDNLVSKQTKRNHINNESYIHDLDSYAVAEHNCKTQQLSWKLKHGTLVGQTWIRPAGGIMSASQLTAVYMQIQSQEQFGGISCGAYDWTLVPYVRKTFFKFYVLSYLMKNEKLTFDYVWNMSFDELDEYVETHKNEYLEKFGLKFEDFRFDNIGKLNQEYAGDALLFTKRETMQAMEALIHNLNTLQSRPGSQLPFSSLNYGTCTLKEGQLIIDGLLEATIRGPGFDKDTPIFPCSIFQMKKGINRKPGDPNYYLYRKALKSTSMRLYPNFANCDFSGQKSWVSQDRKTKEKIINSLSDSDYKKLVDILKVDDNIRQKLTLILDKGEIKIDWNEIPEEIMSTMGCRTQNAYDINFDEIYKANIKSVLENGTLKHPNFLSGAQKDGRGNICPATIIMPTLAMEVLEENEIEDLKNGIISGDNEKKIDKFMRLLSRKIDQTKDGLIDRFEYIASQSPKSAPFMWTNHTMVGYVPEEGIRSALKHGTLAIGNLGLAETLNILIGKDHTTDEGMEVAKRIYRLFRKKCNDFKEEYKLNFGVYMTPAENLCYTAMKKFRDKYGIINNVSDRPYFTNSMHVPVWKEMTPFRKVEIESQLACYQSAGCITYIQLDSKILNNPDALNVYIQDMLDHDLAYVAVNFPKDKCKVCGYQGIFEGDVCPHCGSDNIYHLGRITGYLSQTVDRFNYGKQIEFKERVRHEEHILF